MALTNPQESPEEKGVNRETNVQKNWRCFEPEDVSLARREK